MNEIIAQKRPQYFWYTAPLLHAFESGAQVLRARHYQARPWLTLDVAKGPWHQARATSAIAGS